MAPAAPRVAPPHPSLAKLLDPAFAPTLVTLDHVDPASLDQTEAVGLAEPGPPEQQPTSDDAVVSEVNGNEPGDEFRPSGDTRQPIRVDLKRAGLDRAPVGQLQLRQEATTGAEYPAAGATDPSTDIHRGHEPRNSARRGLLASDPVTSALLAGTIGLGVASFVAYGWLRSEALHTGRTLETELLEAVADPIAVETGQKRTPTLITNELTEYMADYRWRFVLLWLAVGVPAAVLLAVVSRPVSRSLGDRFARRFEPDSGDRHS